MHHKFHQKKESKYISGGSGKWDKENRGRKIMFEEKCFGCTPSQKNPQNGKKPDCMGAVRALPRFSVWPWCSWLVRAAALWCTKWFRRSVAAPLACPRALSTWMLQRLFVVIPRFLDLSVTQNAHGYYPCMASPAASHQVLHLFFFTSWFSSSEQCHIISFQFLA